MKKIFYILLCAAMIAVLLSCNSVQPKSPVNVIMPSSLTAEQQDIIDLLSLPSNQELLLFDFNTVESFSDLEVWVEVYQDGILVDRPAGVGAHSNTAENRSGHLAITVNLIDSNYQWILSVVENNGKSGHIGTTKAPTEFGLARAFGSINEAVEIEDGKEIILYSSVFSKNNFLTFYDGTTLQERPELLNEYPYTHLVKVMFTK